MSACEPRFAPVIIVGVPLAPRGGIQVQLLEAARHLRGDGTSAFSADQLWDAVGGDACGVSRAWVRRLVWQKMPASQQLAVVARGWFCLPGDEATAVVPALAPRAPLPPSGCRAAILEVAEALAARDSDGLIRLDPLRIALAAAGHSYTDATVQFSLAQMTGRSYGTRRGFEDLERVQRGVYRLRRSS